MGHKLRVVMISAFPPHPGGAAKVSQYIHDDLKNMNVDVRKQTVSVTTLIHAPTLSLKTLSYHWSRLKRNAAVLFTMLIGRKAGVVIYIVPSAGFGIYYTLAHFLAARFLYKKVFIQHHSYYGTRPSRVMAFIAFISSKKVIHSFSSQGMAERFMEFYRPIHSHVATNARFVEFPALPEHLPQCVSQPDSRQPLLGHLANLSHAKGFFFVADLLENLLSKGFPGKLLIAGPISEAEVGIRLEQLKKKFGDRIEYMGPLYGDAKASFYRTIDLFLFPSQFSQEAHPLVVLEAQAGGAPVLATPRGGIAEMVGGELGTCFPDEEFISEASDYVMAMSFRNEDRARRKQTVAGLFRQMLKVSNSEYAALYQRMLSLTQ